MFLSALLRKPGICKAVYKFLFRHPELVSGSFKN